MNYMLLTKFHYFITLLVTFSIICGCTFEPGPENSPASDEQEITSVTVMALDRTEGMTLFSPGRQLAEQLVLKAEPGSHISFRFISDRSYADDQLIAMLAIPPTPTAPEVKNVYDIRGKRAYAAAIEQQRAAEAQLKLKTIEDLRSYSCLQDTKSTDLMGAIQSASERLASTGKRASRTLILATDAIDNRRMKATPDLSGVKVIIHLLGHDADPEKVRQLKERWTKRLKSWSAESIEFPYVEMSATEKEETLCDQ